MRVLTLIACLTVALPALAEEGYLCIADQATGFTLDDAGKNWRRVNFQTDQLKWKIERRKESLKDNLIVHSGDSWVVVNPNDSHLISMGCAESIDRNNLLCEGLGPRLKINKQTLRLLFTYERGYWTEHVDGQAKSPEMPMIAIGRCQSQ